MNFMNIFKWVTYTVVLIGALNWGLIGAFDFDLISFLFGEMSMISRVIYSIVGLCAVGYLIFSIKDKKRMFALQLLKLFKERFKIRSFYNFSSHQE